MTASAQGLDVSNYQGKFDWARAVTTAKAAGAPLSFGITRVTQGLGGPGTGSPDPDASWDWLQIRGHGLYRGGYHFFDPRLDGAPQARYFVDTLAKLGLGTSAMLFLDNEATNGCSPQHVAVRALAFMAELVTLRPHNPRGVYANFNFAKGGYCAGLGRYPLWIAHPAAAAPSAADLAGTPWTRWAFWQWGQRNGVDVDAFNGTHDQLTAWVNSFHPVAAPKLAGPAAHVADGAASLRAVANAHGTTVQRCVWLTATHYSRAFEPDMAAYVGKGDWDAPMPKGMTIWTWKP